MKINVGSKNETKINAVAQAIKFYPKVSNAEIVGIDVNVETYGHPKSLNEVISGAMDRAMQAFTNCDYAVGIESGLMDFELRN